MKQLQNAWNTGDYASVNNLVNQNNLTTTTAQSIWGITPQQAAAHGVNLIQPTPTHVYTPQDYVNMITPPTTTAAATNSAATT